MNEIKKGSKIIDELVTFFLRKNYYDINVDMKYSSESTIIVITIDFLSDDDMDLVNMCLSQKRDIIMEEYAWELIGESEKSAELNLVGICIDEYDIETLDNLKQKITLIRKHH